MVTSSGVSAGSRTRAYAQVSEIMESYPANSIGRMQALRLATEQETKIAKSVGETYLNAFVSRGWLAKSA